MSAGGNRSGGGSFSRGALYQILKNRLYLGEIPHRGLSHPGEHKAIVPLSLWEKVQAKLRSDNQGRRNGVRMHSPSLLTGLLEDAEGRRFTPSHTVKNGKRYRYYASQVATNGLGPQKKSIRLPAHDIEKAFSVRLRSFLESTRDVLDNLGLPEDSPALTETLASASMEQSEQWATASPVALQDFVRKVVRRVVVRTDKIIVEASKRELRRALIDSQFTSAVHRNRDEHSDDLIRLDVATRLTRCGCEMRLLVPPDSQGEMETRLVMPLLKAIARAHDWCEQLVTGKDSTIRSIAEKTGLNERYVRRVLSCAFLAPDIIEAILNGSQPPDLTFEKLTRRVSLNWVEQRQQLGFAIDAKARKTVCVI
jgi:site-specific DNA recombinase